LPELKTVLPNADFVIEGCVDPTEPLRDEGPFGDHTGSSEVRSLKCEVRNYSSQSASWAVFIPHSAFRIRHSTFASSCHHRRHPADGRLLHRRRGPHPACGHPLPSDGRGAGGEGLNFPEIVDLALPAEGVFHNLVFVSIKKTYPMQAYKIMHGLWGMGQMMFTKYIVVVDDDVNVHNTSEVLFRLCANTDPQRDSIFTKGPADVLDHATSEIASGSKLGIDATKKLPGEGFKRPWPPLIKMDAAVKAKMERLFNL
jgi:4-hydroxy-3-polyprenylbenzoate decarboxylase